MNPAYWENGTNDQIVAYSVRKIKLNGLETFGEISTPKTVASTTTTKQNQSQKNRTPTKYTPILQKSKPCHKECRIRIRKEHERQDEKKLLQD